VAVRALERLRTRLAGAQLGNAPRFTVSFGVTDTRAAESLERMLQIADGGLYESKRAGRDRITIGDGDGDAPEPAPEDRAQPEASKDGRRGNGRRPLMHEAADEEDPRPTGLEIR
jgi:hypothetical protein